MYKLIFLCGFFAVVLSAPAGKDVVPIISQEFVLDPDGHFHWNYESGDGSKAGQVGELKVFDKDRSGEVMSGGYEYKGTDGKTYALTYTADENGFHPQGDHLPVPPPIPAAIAKALAYLATARPPKA